MQVVFYLLGAGAIYLAIKPSRQSGKIISGVLAFFWLWMGLVYHITYFSGINNAAYLFGVVFIIQGVMIAILGICQDRLSFKLTADKYGITGISLMLFALFIYPIAGYFFGHVYPFAPTFGLPCPTTIFTFGFFLLTVRQFPRALLIIPFAWSIVGFLAVMSFGMVEDTGLLLSALLAVSLLLARRNQQPLLPNPARTASPDGPGKLW